MSDHSANSLSDETRQRLIAAAAEARANAYVPYSNYPVGAAIVVVRSPKGGMNFELLAVSD